jgi:septal ring factor EnvC (AmiA/AmiB activator)
MANPVQALKKDLLTNPILVLKEAAYSGLNPDRAKFVPTKAAVESAIHQQDPARLVAAINTLNQQLKAKTSEHIITQKLLDRTKARYSSVQGRLKQTMEEQQQREKAWKIELKETQSANRRAWRLWWRARTWLSQH